MKNLKIIILTALLLLSQPAFALTLWDYYNGNLPSIEERKPIYAEYFNDEYKGTAKQNTDLLSKLESKPSQIVLGASLPSGVAVFQTSLLSAITSSATSMTLVANNVRGGGTLSGFQCFTIDEGSSIAEYVCGTVSGTSVTSMTRGIDPLTGTTTNATLQFAHRRGAEVKVTDFPVIQIMRNQLNGSDTFDNLLKYTTGTGCGVGSVNTTLCDKAYIDGVAVAGASNANTTTKGIVEIATAIENASSTATGSTGATLTPSASIASSTPTRGCDGTATAGALCSVVARNDGKIHPNYIATSSTDVYNFGAKQNFNANASTTGISAGYGYFGSTATSSISSTGVLTLATTTAGVLQTSSTGVVYAGSAPKYTYSTTSPAVNAVINGYATSSANFLIPALNASSTIQFKGNFNCDNTANGDGNCSIYLKKSTGETLTVVTVTSDNPVTPTYFFDILISNKTITSNWLGVGYAVNFGPLKGVSTVGGAVVDTTSTESLASGATLQVVLNSSAANTQIVITNYSIVINP